MKYQPPDDDFLDDDEDEEDYLAHAAAFYYLNHLIRQRKIELNLTPDRSAVKPPSLP